MRYYPIVLNGHRFSMPAISLGSVYFGTEIERNEAFAMMDYYSEMGGTWLDTARVYGVPLFPPEKRTPEFRDSEETIGDWVKTRQARNKVTVITKGAHWSLETKEKRVHPAAIRADMELSLRKLNMEHVDIYFLHNDDERVPVSEIMPILHELIREGKTLAVGASNWRAERIMEANAFAEAHSLTPFSISQVKWSYAVPTDRQSKPTIDMEADNGEYEAYVRARMPVMAYSSQARGFFIKAASRGLDDEQLGSAASFSCEENIRRAKAVMQVSESKGISIPAASQSYLWSREIPVTALVGGNTVEQLKSSMEDCDFAPDRETVELLEGARWQDK